MIHGTQTTKDHLAGYPSPLVFEVGTDPSSSGRNHSWGEKTELLAAQALPVLWLQMWMENSLYLPKPFKHTSHTNLKNCGSSKTARKFYMVENIIYQLRWDTHSKSLNRVSVFSLTEMSCETTQLQILWHSLHRSVCYLLHLRLLQQNLFCTESVCNHKGTREGLWRFSFLTA